MNSHQNSVPIRERQDAKRPLLLASTGNFFQRSILATLEASAADGDSRRRLMNSDGKNYIQVTQLSPDGSTLLVHSADNSLRTEILPPDLLTSPPHTLKPFSTISSAEPVYASIFYPGFSLSDPSSMLALSSPRDHPIRLSSLLPGCPKVASYPFVSPTTEEYYTPHSLIFTNAQGTHFLAGTRDLIGCFDVSRNGQGPVQKFHTATTKRRNGRLGIPGLVTAMALEPSSNVLAAGTYTRGVGLYDSGGMGDVIARWRLSGSGTAKDAAEDEIYGSGVTQVAWSPCGRYLCVAERCSDGARIYDVRVTGQLLGWIRSRRATSMQRMSFDVCPGGSSTGGGFQIYAGGVDGRVRVWDGVGEHIGSMDVSAREPAWKLHDDAVTATIVHGCGNVLITSSGQRHLDEWESESDTSSQGSSSCSSCTSSSEASSSSDSEVTKSESEDKAQGFENSVKVWKLAI